MKAVTDDDLGAPRTVLTGTLRDELRVVPHRDVPAARQEDDPRARDRPTSHIHDSALDPARLARRVAGDVSAQLDERRVLDEERAAAGRRPERIAADLREYLGDDAVEIFPAWETLPFERVSPSIETNAARSFAMSQSHTLQALIDDESGSE